MAAPLLEFVPSQKLLASLSAFLIIAAIAAAFPVMVSAQTQSVEGWLHVIWDVGVSPDHPEGRAYLLVGRDGNVVELDLSRVGRRETAEILAHDRRLIEVTAERVQRSEARVTPTLFRVQSMRPLERTPLQSEMQALEPFAAPAQPIPFITILCRFADDTATPFARVQIDRMMGSTYPGMSHYFAELAAGSNVMAGNQVTDWYTLPSPRGAYVNGQQVNISALARDCTAAADADVYFPNFFGVNLQFNGNLSVRAEGDTLSFGGSITLNLDGQMRQYGMTWLSRTHATNYVVHAHEMGHALGWPHSSGRYGTEYDSRWDLMSVGYLNYTQEFGWLSIHTIVPYKDQLGWIPSSRRWQPGFGTHSSGIVARAALPPPRSDYLMARIPLTTGTGDFYTVETRRIAGYDARLPGEAVVIHHVQGTRAYVVDPDNNRNPNDDAAMWLPGETFADSIGGVSVRVDSATATGFGVTITRGWLLEVAVLGRGRVSSSPSGISCGTTCTMVLGTRGTAASLTAVPEDGWIFLGWSGVCSGTDGCGLTMNGNRAVSALFAEPLTILSDSVRAIGIPGVAYADTLKVSGGTGTTSWALTGGALPAGLSLEAATGVIRGTPSETGEFRYRITATSATLTASKFFALQVNRRVTIDSDTTRRVGVLGTAYADTLTASGGTGIFIWTLTGGALPSGLRLDPTGGTVSGTPGEAGTFHFTVSATSATLSTSKTLRLVVLRPLTILSDSLRPPATMGAVYADTLKVSGGTGSWTWTPASGAMPRGIVFDIVSGVVSGIPEEIGAFHYIVTATSGPLSVTRSFSMAVTKPVLQAEAILDQLLGSGSLTTDQLRFLDLLGNRNGRLDVGDVRAWLLDNQQLSGEAAQSLRSLVEAMNGRDPDGTREPSVQKEKP